MIEPLLSGGDRREYSVRDLEYVRDLGLVALGSPLRIANPISAEVVPRELTSIAQEESAQEESAQEAAWYVDDRGGLAMCRLMEEFQSFFREHSEHWRERFAYKEAAPQLLLQAFLQKVVNGGGRIEREYGLGRGRTDLLVEWRAGAETQKLVVECKVLRRSLDRAIRDGVRQAAAYMDRCVARSGRLVISDRRDDRSWREKVFHRKEASPAGPVEVWGM